MPDDKNYYPEKTVPEDLEVRVVALVLGEADESEKVELERLMGERPELRIFRRRIGAIHGLIGEATPKAQIDEAWRLSPERRQKVLDKISGARNPGDAGGEIPVAETEKNSPSWNRVALFSVAAMVVAGLFVAVLAPRYNRVLPPSESSVVGDDARRNIPLVGKGETAFGRHYYDNYLNDEEFLGTFGDRRLKQAEYGSRRDAIITDQELFVAVDEKKDVIRKAGRGVFANKPGSIEGKIEGLETIERNVARQPVDLGGRAKKGRLLSESFGSGDSKNGRFRELRGYRSKKKSESRFGRVGDQDQGSAGELGEDFIVFKELADYKLRRGNYGFITDREDEEESLGLDWYDGATLGVPLQVGKDQSLEVVGEVPASEEAFSTFSLNVSDVSFKAAQAALLGKGEWPDRDVIRVEEFVNAFDYGDPTPRVGDPVSCAMGQAAHPFRQQRNLLRIAMRTAAAGRAAGQPLRLTILLDNSGSMERADRAVLVRRAMSSLASLLGEADTVSLVGFARTPRLLADRLPGDRGAELVEIVGKIPAEGGTNLEEALRLGEQLARRQYDEGAVNRVVLMTDGAANLGNAKPEELARLIGQLRQQGIAFDACGVGADGLNDGVLEALTRKGDGRYYLLDRPEDAGAGFADKLAGTFRPAAKNVKVQVKFNPRRVGSYRLFGFEKHRLEKEDFRDDAVDAAELAAEEVGVALYQIEVLPGGAGEIGEVFVRFFDVAKGEMVERSWVIPYSGNVASFAQGEPPVQLAGTAALLAERLKGGAAGSVVRLEELSEVLSALRLHYVASPEVQRLAEMVEKARSLEQ